LAWTGPGASPRRRVALARGNRVQGGASGKADGLQAPRGAARGRGGGGGARPPPGALPGDLPSGPGSVGPVQLPPGGEPIVLMPDGPTVGGYPRIAVVASPDVGRLAQRSPGQAVRFREIGLREARAGLQRRWNLLERVAESA